MEFSQMAAMVKLTQAMKRIRRVNLRQTVTHPTIEISHRVMTLSQSIKSLKEFSMMN